MRDTKSSEMSSIWSTVFVCAIAQSWSRVSVEGAIRCHDSVTLERLGLAPGSSKEDGNSNEGIDKSCFGERWCTPSFYPTATSRAPRPEEAQASFYVYKSSNTRRVSGSSRKTGRRPKLIGIELRWSNKASQMTDITGYTINFHSTRQLFGYDVCFNDVLVHNTTTEEDGSRRVHFIYRYICENDECVALEPGHKILVTIISMPGDFDVGEDTAAYMLVKIPDCRHKKTRKTIHCARRRHARPEQQQQELRTTVASTITATDNNTISSSPSSTGIGLTTFSITLGGIAFSIAFIGWITWGLNANIGRRKRILFLEKINEELDNPCSYAFQSLVYEIRKHDLADITYNRWETVRLIADPMTWIRNATAQSDIIVALVSPQTSNESCINLYFNEWINSLIGSTRNEETSGKKIALVSFHLKKQDSWPDFGNRDNLCKFKLPEELRKFYDNLFSEGPRKCPFSTDEMVSLANEANERTRPKMHKATKTVRLLLSLAGDESQNCSKK